MKLPFFALALALVLAAPALTHAQSDAGLVMPDVDASEIFPLMWAPIYIDLPPLYDSEDPDWVAPVDAPLVSWDPADMPPAQSTMSMASGGNSASKTVVGPAGSVSIDVSQTGPGSFDTGFALVPAPGWGRLISFTGSLIVQFYSVDGGCLVGQYSQPITKIMLNPRSNFGLVSGNFINVPAGTLISVSLVGSGFLTNGYYVVPYITTELMIQ